ncbi:MAG: GmrSD restriction endonuclease domain-containing protein, partial [Mycobacteriales bacterium]
MTRRRCWTLGGLAAAALLAGCATTGTTSLAAKGGPSVFASPVPSASPSAAPSSPAPTPSPSSVAAPS